MISSGRQQDLFGSSKFIADLNQIAKMRNIAQSGGNEGINRQTKTRQQEQIDGQWIQEGPAARKDYGQDGEYREQVAPLGLKITYPRMMHGKTDDQTRTEEGTSKHNSIVSAAVPCDCDDQIQ